MDGEYRKAIQQVKFLKEDIEVLQEELQHSKEQVKRIKGHRDELQETVDKLELKVR